MLSVVWMNFACSMFITIVFFHHLKAIPIAQAWKIKTVPCVFTAASFCVFVR